MVAAYDDEELENVIWFQALSGAFADLLGRWQAGLVQYEDVVKQIDQWVKDWGESPPPHMPVPDH